MRAHLPANSSEPLRDSGTSLPRLAMTLARACVQSPRSVRRLLQRDVPLRGRRHVRLLVSQPAVSRRLRLRSDLQRNLRQRRVHLRSGRDLLVRVRGAAVPGHVRRVNPACDGTCADGTCACGRGSVCHFACASGPCHTECPAGASCAVVCPHAGLAGHAGLRHRLVRGRQARRLPRRAHGDVRHGVPVGLTSITPPHLRRKRAPGQALPWPPAPRGGCGPFLPSWWRRQSRSSSPRR